MNEVEEIISRIPIRHNLVSTIMVLGIVQGFFISLVLLVRMKTAHQSIKIFFFFILCLCILSTDTYLCYSGQMKYVLFLNDSTEPLVLILGPLIYLMLLSLLERKKVTLRTHWYHFMPALIYFLTQIGFYIQPVEVKLNAYLGAYFAEWKQVEVRIHLHYYYHIIKDHFRWYIILSLIVYTFLSTKVVYLQNQSEVIKGPWKIKTDKYGFAKNAVIIFLLVIIILLTVFLNYSDDMGDHYIVMFICLSMFVYSFFMMTESRLFENAWIMDKYETSGFKSDHNNILEKVTEYIEKENYFLNKEASLKDLAGKLALSPNYISQAINSVKEQNFNEFINFYRVEEIKKRLLDDDYANLSIVGIGDTVGFKSKSAFYNAFKKYTEMTPTAFVKQYKSTKTAE